MKSGSKSALSLATAQAKALKLFDTAKQHYDEGSKDKKFNANKGWFMHFKGSDALHNIRVQDEAGHAEVAVPQSRLPVWKTVTGLCALTPVLATGHV